MTIPWVITNDNESQRIIPRGMIICLVVVNAVVPYLGNTSPRVLYA